MPYPNLMTGDWITAAATVVLCVLIWCQTRLVGRSTKAMENTVQEMKSTREADILLNVHQLVRRFVHPSRERIYEASRHPGEELNTFREKLYASRKWNKNAWRLAYAWNEIAGLCQHGLVSPEPIIDFYPQLIEECWWILEPTILKVRSAGSPDNSKPFEWLVKQARGRKQSDAVGGRDLKGVPLKKPKEGGNQAES